MHLLLHYVKGVLKLLTGRFTVSNQKLIFSENSEQVICILNKIYRITQRRRIAGRLAKKRTRVRVQQKFVSLK